MVEMTPGDFVNIPAHKKHRVEWTTPEASMICLAVHYGNGSCRDCRQMVGYLDRFSSRRSSRLDKPGDTECDHSR